MFKNFKSGVFYLVMFFSGMSYAAQGINAASDISIDSIKITDVTTCYENANGTLIVYASGVNSIEYSLDNAVWQDTNYIDSLAIGDYTVYLRDADSPDDYISRNFSVLGPQKLEASYTKQDITTTDTGYILISATGGTGTLLSDLSKTLPLTNFTTNMSYLNLDTGWYNISVKDDNNCSVDTTLEIYHMIPLVISFNDVLGTPVPCHPDDGDANGQIIIQLELTNLTFPLDVYLEGSEFSKLIPNQNSLPIIIKNVAADNYVASIYDNSNPRRYIRKTFKVDGAKKITIDDVTINSANCLFLEDGATDIGKIKLNTISGGNPPFEFAWTHDFTNSNQSDSAINLSGGTYVVTVKDANNCMHKQSYTVPYDTANTPKIISPDSVSACYNQPYILQVSSERVANYSWEEQGADLLWQPIEDSTVYPTGLSIFNFNNYRVTATSPNKCLDYDSTKVYVYERATIELEDFIQRYTNNDDFLIEPVIENTGNFALNYLWESDDIDLLNDATLQSPTFEIPNEQDSFKYIFTLTTENNCVEKDSLLIYVEKEINIPSAFSPNGDHYNDTWFLEISRYYEVEVIVFSRWGEVLYTEKKKDIAWDGKVNGKDLPIGTYYFIVTIDKPGEVIEPITGPLTIVR